MKRLRETERLSDLRPGESGVLCALECEGNLRRRLMDIGLVEGTEVRCLFQSLWGDPRAYDIRGTVFALRGADAARLRVKRAAATNPSPRLTAEEAKP